jgi:hypothetical protein
MSKEMLKPDSAILNWLIYHARARTFRTGLLAETLGDCDDDPRAHLIEMMARFPMPNKKDQT